jgi:hypothetical protein
MEWDPNHFRLFIGDLGNDVNDEDLIKAFGPDKGWKSFVKAKVIRDKVTQKTRGYGFVSYSDPEDFMAGEQFRVVPRIRENLLLMKQQTTFHCTLSAPFIINSMEGHEWTICRLKTCQDSES